MDIFVAKFDAAGNHLWSKRFGDAGQQTPTSVAVDAIGNVLLTGYFMGSADFGGGVLTSAGGVDIFVAKFDSAGNHLWNKRFGDAEQQLGQSVALDGTGDVVVTGDLEGSVDFGGGPLTSAGSTDIFVVKFDAAGNHLWSKRFGDASQQDPSKVAVDGAGNIVITGGFDGVVDFGGGALTSAGGDIFVAKFDAAGNHLWSKRFGDGNLQNGLGVAVDSMGNILAAGVFQGSVDFGGGPLTSAGSWDIYVAKFAGAASSVGGIAEQPNVTALPSLTTGASSEYRIAYELPGVVGVLAVAAAGAGAIWRRLRVS